MKIALEQAIRVALSNARLYAIPKVYVKAAL
jgi:hypothetical protein